MSSGSALKKKPQTAQPGGRPKKASEYKVIQTQIYKTNYLG